MSPSVSHIVVLVFKSTATPTTEAAMEKSTCNRHARHHNRETEAFDAAKSPCNLIEQISLPISSLARTVSGGETERTLAFEEGKAAYRAGCSR
ncbi:hypothetical protein EV128_13438 [Rhizobium azibense]|nr:hypothetical protein EV128_13438 [Rhizobium azibense]